MNREKILEEAAIGERERTFGLLTVRKITPRDEILFGRLGCKLLSIAILKQIADGKVSAEITEDLAKAVFICSQDPFRMLSLSKSGADVFETAFFEWLGNVDHEVLQRASAWVLTVALEVAAAAFKVADEIIEAPGGHSKNVLSPAERPL